MSKSGLFVLRFNDHPSGPGSDTLTFIHRVNEQCYYQRKAPIFGEPKFQGFDRECKYSCEARYVEEYGSARILYPLGFPHRNLDGYRVIAKTEHGRRMMMLAMGRDAVSGKGE